MGVWKFIWLRPLWQAAIPTAICIIAALIKGSNANGAAEWIERTLEVFAGFYLFFVGLAALAWKRAVPVQKPE